MKKLLTLTLLMLFPIFITSCTNEDWKVIPIFHNIEDFEQYVKTGVWKSKEMYDPYPERARVTEEKYLQIDKIFPEIGLPPNQITVHNKDWYDYIYYFKNYAIETASIEEFPEIQPDSSIIIRIRYNKEYEDKSTSECTKIILKNADIQDTFKQVTDKRERGGYFKQDIGDRQIVYGVQINEKTNDYAISTVGYAKDKFYIQIAGLHMIDPEKLKTEKDLRFVQNLLDPETAGAALETIDKVIEEKIAESNNK